MPFRFSCRKCGYRGVARRRHIGTNVRCPKCRAVNRVKAPRGYMAKMMKKMAHLTHMGLQKIVGKRKRPKPPPPELDFRLGRQSVIIDKAQLAEADDDPNIRTMDSFLWAFAALTVMGGSVLAVFYFLKN